MIDPLVGQTFGQYQIQDRLGRGGMAAVYRALQPSLGRQVAIKVLPLDRLPDPTLPERFRREARTAANLMHPNVVPVHDFGELHGYLFIVMALITGGTLKERTRGPMPIEAAVQLVGHVADALGYAHGQGIYHRDVKPTNILIAPGDWPMLSDFGIARALGETTRLTNPHGTIGTPAYMAPEQWLGGEIDGRSDLYSLGIVLYELLAGTPPFTATTSQGLMRQHLEEPVPRLALRRSDLPLAIEEVLETVLAKSPDARYRHAGELKAALDAATRQPQAPVSFSQTNLVGLPPTTRTRAQPGQTMQGGGHLHPANAAPPHHKSGGMSLVLLMLVLAVSVLLVGAGGFLVVGSRLGVAGVPQTASKPETSEGAAMSTSTPQAPATSTPQPVPTATPLIVVVTATPQPPTPTLPAKPAVAQQAVPARNVLTAPPPSAPQMTDLDANRARIQREGFTPDQVAQSPDGQGDFLTAIRGVCTRPDGGNCQKVFFFIGSRYLGTDTFRESRSITNVLSGGGQRIRVTYGNYRPGDPQCCPSLSAVTITYTWDGSRLTPDGTPPGH